MRQLSFLAAILALSRLSLADSSPVLQWVQTFGSGLNTVIGAAADTQGNLYVVGNNTSIAAALAGTPGGNVFAVKLDPSGNTVYSTSLGGSANNLAVAMALGADGSVYVTGTTSSSDFPVTPGAYATTFSGASSNFLFKLNPDGSPAWATYFADDNNPVKSIAVDSAGNPYLGGVSMGNLPTTAGAYQTGFLYSCRPTFLIGCLPGTTSAFVAKFNAKGTGLIYSTYVPTDLQENSVQIAQALALDSSGDVYLGGEGNVVLLNAAGSALLASNIEPGLAIAALALDAGSNLYATGVENADLPLQTTPGAFQTGPQPAVPTLQGQVLPGGGTDAFVVKWDSRLSQVLAATPMASLPSKVRSAGCRATCIRSE